MQWSRSIAAGDLALGPFGVRQGTVGHDVYKRATECFGRFDPAQHRLRQLYRGNVAVGEQPRSFSDGKKAQVFGHHSLVARTRIANSAPYLVPAPPLPPPATRPASRRPADGPVPG